jgi:hypothetical protein
MQRPKPLKANHFEGRFVDAELLGRPCRAGQPARSTSVVGCWAGLGDGGDGLYPRRLLVVDQMRRIQGGPSNRARVGIRRCSGRLRAGSNMSPTSSTTSSDRIANAAKYCRASDATTSPNKVSLSLKWAYSRSLLALAAYGGAVGQPDSARELLRHNETVLVFPGGGREMPKFRAQNTG